MILHDLTIAARICNRVLALRGGDLVAIGAPSEVLSPEPLRDTFGIAFDCLTLPGGKQTILPAGL